MADTTDRDPALLCIMCDNSGAFSCSGCHTMRFCSRACQKADWPLHKVVCKSFQAHSKVERPGENCIRAIVFDEDEDEPRFVWIACERDVEDRLVPQLYSFPSLLPTAPAPLLVFPDNKLLNRKLPKKIGVWGNMWDVRYPDAPNNGLKNKSVRKVDEELTDVIFGSIIALGMYRDADNRIQSYDLGPLEFRHIIDNLRIIHRLRVYLLKKTVTGPSVKGIQWDCHGDASLCQGETRLSVDVPVASLPSQSEVPSWIADQIGVPLLVQKLPPALAWRDRKMVGGEPCMHNSFVYTMNPFNDDGALDHCPGSILITRKDGKPLLKAHLMAIEIYAKLMRDDMEDVHPLQRETYKAAYTRENFVTFSKVWAEENADRLGVAGEDIPSIYDI